MHSIGHHAENLSFCHLAVGLHHLAVGLHHLALIEKLRFWSPRAGRKLFFYGREVMKSDREVTKAVH